MYPHFLVENNKKPNRFYAFPLIGLMTRVVFLVPHFLECIILAIVNLLLLFINWFVVLFTGKYWNPAYTMFVKTMQFSTKISLFLYGITDKYPTFGLNTNNLFTLSIPKPEHPKRWLAIPFIGIFVRFFLLLPYFIFAEVLGRGSGVGMAISWFTVLFKGKLPESIYEFEKDALRVGLATQCYMLGLSDKYPSFEISMNHQNAKIGLLIVGAMLTAWGMSSNAAEHDTTYQESSSYQYNQQPGYMNSY